QKIGTSEKELEGLRERIATLRSDVRKWKEDVKRNQEAIARKERSASKATQLRDREIWLEEYFIPTLESIERHVMNSINREFGFSKEQLGKVREILDEIANPQVIIVSHERELESFADQIYRVVKVQGESKISR